jgi:hypothetical protein
MAGLPVLGLPALLVGTMIATDGDATPNVPIAVGSQAQADAHFGQGSELSRSFKAYFANNFANQVYGLPVAEPVGATAASATITVTTPPTDSGVVSLYIGGEAVPVPVAGAAAFARGRIQNTGAEGARTIPRQSGSPERRRRRMGHVPLWRLGRHDGRRGVDQYRRPSRRGRRAQQAAFR